MSESLMYAYKKLNIEHKKYKKWLSPTKPQIPQTVKHPCEQHAHERP